MRIFSAKCLPSREPGPKNRVSGVVGSILGLVSSTANVFQKSLLAWADPPLNPAYSIRILTILAQNPMSYASEKKPNINALFSSSRRLGFVVLPWDDWRDVGDAFRPLTGLRADPGLMVCCEPPLEFGRLFEVEEVGGRDEEEGGRLLEEGGRLDDEGRDDTLEEAAVVALCEKKKRKKERDAQGGLMHVSRLMSRGKTGGAEAGFLDPCSQLCHPNCRGSRDWHKQGFSTLENKRCHWHGGAPYVKKGHCR